MQNRAHMLRHHRLGLLLASVIVTPCSAAPFITLPNNFDIYNTGIDLNAGVDQRYTMTVNPYNGSGVAFLTSAGYLSPNNADSAWLSPSGTNVHAPESVYHIATTIDLTGIDPAYLSLHGYWVSDNKGLDILINGNPTGQTNTGSHTQAIDALPGNAFTLDSAGGLIAGVNTVTFVWGNGPAGGAGSQFPNPIHIRVQFTGYAITLPGDLNNDGFVGIEDLNIVLGNWNQTVPPADPAADPSGDNYVGIEDLNTVLGNWNDGSPPGSLGNTGSAVPEPAGAVLVIVAGLPMMSRRPPDT